MPSAIETGNVRIADEETQQMYHALLDAFDGKRSEAIREAIRYYYQNKIAPPPVTLGYVAIDRRGDIGPDASCPQCGSPLTKPYLWFSDNGAFGILCSGCATSE